MSRVRIFTKDKRRLVRELVQQGYKPVEIAEKIGITLGSLKSLCSRYGIRLSSETSIHAAVSPSCYESLAVEADRMNMTVPRITALILEVVTKDGLFEALSLEPPNQGI